MDSYNKYVDIKSKSYFQVERNSNRINYGYIKTDSLHRAIGK